MKTSVSLWTSLISKVGLAPEVPEGNKNTRLPEEESCLICHAGLILNSLEIKNHKQSSVANCNCCRRIPNTSQSVSVPAEKASSPGVQTVGNIGKTSTVYNSQMDEVWKIKGCKMQAFDVVEYQGNVSGRKRRREEDMIFRNKYTWKKSRRKRNYSLLSVRTSNFRIRFYYQLTVLKRNSLSRRQYRPFTSYPIIPNIGVERSKPISLPERRIDSVFGNCDMKFQNVVTIKTVDNEEIFVLDI